MLSSIKEVVSAQFVGFVVPHMTMIKKPREVDGTQSVPSFILGLMGVDESFVPAPASKKVKVLSDNYLNKIASIGSRKKSAENYALKQQSDEKSSLRMRESLRRIRVYGDLTGISEGLSTVSGKGEKIDYHFKLMNEKNAKNSFPCNYNQPKHLKVHTSLCGICCAIGKNRSSSSHLRKLSAPKPRFCKEARLKEDTMSQRLRVDQRVVIFQLGAQSGTANELLLSFDSEAESTVAGFPNEEKRVDKDNCAWSEVSSDDSNANQCLEVKEEKRNDASEAEERVNFWVLLNTRTEGDCDPRKVSGDVFNCLKKKHSKCCDRLMFDRVNSLVKEKMEPCMGIPRWRNSVVERICVRKKKEAVEDEIWSMLEAQELEIRKDSNKVLGKDDGWMRLVDEIHFIGDEIESFLIQELLQDFLCS